MCLKLLCVSFEQHERKHAVVLLPVPTSVEHFEQVKHKAQLEDLGKAARNALGQLLA